ncbi:type II secretion protein F [Paenibacillus darwinianus]|uniref:Type II secretion protein F n=1 Tax=Paenibacillus darwinianus TaxID=1380763 RepID=A0A9W5W861_9BACL|nr:type II secretion system F family protein [Paenibacillus darwinianus]EXX89660.1 type II secretion protein F [Paenibacillus darwinianus]EXX89966.1 type II secretion protein F [Paenibacillus darwinianus]EXX90226.1 type II secretion protein F [Paenibacillus darwinianus]
MVVVALLLMGLWVAAVPAAWRRGKRSAGRRTKGAAAFEELLLVMPFLYLLERGQLFAALSGFTSAVQAKLVLVRGEETSAAAGKQLLAGAAGAGYAVFTAMTALGSAVDEPALLTMGLVLAVLLPVVRIRALYRQVEERRRQIVQALPDMLGTLMLLVGAGETVQQALFRCMGHGKPDHPLYNELRRTLHSIRNGEPFGQAMEGFGRRCGVREVSVFTAVLLLNCRKGGDSFVLALRELSFTLWEKRKAVARTRGEEASSKLAFPLVGIFMLLMILVGAPALLSLS